MATLGTYVHFSKATSKARERAVLISVAQREMEALRPISFSKLGLTSAPSSQATTEAPLGGRRRLRAGRHHRRHPARR